MKQMIWGFFVIASLVAMLLAGCQRAGEPVKERVPPAPVNWQEPKQRLVSEWTELVGTTRPRQAASVSASVESVVVSILQCPRGVPLSEGQYVKKGDILVQLDNRIARANREKANVEVEELRQQAKQAELMVKLNEIDVRRFQELERISTADQLLISPIEQEKARWAWEGAKSKEQQAIGRLRAGERRLNALDEQLSLYMLKAPISGKLGRVKVVRGQAVTAGHQITEIVDLEEEIDLLCFVPQFVANLMHEGQVVQVVERETRPGFIAAFGTPDTALSEVPCAEGHLVYIADRAEPSTGNIAVKARLPNSHLKLRANLTLRVRVLTAQERLALTLPDSAILEDEDPTRVIVVTDYKLEKDENGNGIETGNARMLQVRLGIRDHARGLVEILALSDPGARGKWQGSLETTKFVVERAQGLRNGDIIRRQKEAGVISDN
jgi:RND family efflux transporter MFP subunit